MLSDGSSIFDLLRSNMVVQRPRVLNGTVIFSWCLVIYFTMYFSVGTFTANDLPYMQTCLIFLWRFNS